MHIHGVSQAHGPQNLQSPQAASRSEAPAANRSAQAADQLDISAAADAVADAVDSGNFRADLVARVRSEIAAGTYVTPDKLDAALDRFLDESA